MPNLIRGKGSDFNGIVNNLRQIGSAKLAVSLERGITNGAYIFSEAELSPYIGRSATGGFVIPIRGERYVINQLGSSPEAHLARKLKYGDGTFNAGSIIRFDSNGAAEILPPSK